MPTAISEHNLLLTEALRKEEEDLMRRLHIAEDNLARSLRDDHAEDRLLQELSEEEFRLRGKIDAMTLLIEKQERKIDQLERKVDAEFRIEQSLKADIERVCNDIDEIEITLDALHAKESQLKRSCKIEINALRELKKRIVGEIDGVYSNMMSTLDEIVEHRETRRSMEESLKSQLAVYQNSFKRWRNVWPTLNLWLYSESESVSSINSASILQGLVGEWTALANMTTKLKDLTLSSSSNSSTQTYLELFDKPLTSFVHMLRIQLEQRKEQCNVLNQKITEAEENRKNIRSLSFELSNALSEDLQTAKATMKNILRSTGFSDGLASIPVPSRIPTHRLPHKTDKVMAELRDQLYWAGEDIETAKSYSKRILRELEQRPKSGVGTKTAEHIKMKTSLDILLQPERANSIIEDIFDSENYEEEDHFQREDDVQGGLGVIETGLQRSLACVSVLESRKSFQHMKCAALSLYKNLTKDMLKHIQQTEESAENATKLAAKPVEEIYKALDINSTHFRPYSAISINGRTVDNPDAPTGGNEESSPPHDSFDDQVNLGMNKFQDWLDFKITRNFASVMLDTLPLNEDWILLETVQAAARLQKLILLSIHSKANSQSSPTDTKKSKPSTPQGSSAEDEGAPFYSNRKITLVSKPVQPAEKTNLTFADVVKSLTHSKDSKASRLSLVVKKHKSTILNNFRKERRKTLQVPSSDSKDGEISKETHHSDWGYPPINRPWKKDNNIQMRIRQGSVLLPSEMLQAYGEDEDSDSDRDKDDGLGSTRSPENHSMRKSSLSNTTDTVKQDPVAKVATEARQPVTQEKTSVEVLLLEQEGKLKSTKDTKRSELVKMSLYWKESTEKLRFVVERLERAGERFSFPLTAAEVDNIFEDDPLDRNSSKNNRMLCLALVSRMAIEEIPRSYAYRLISKSTLVGSLSEAFRQVGPPEVVEQEGTIPMLTIRNKKTNGNLITSTNSNGNFKTSFPPWV